MADNQKTGGVGFAGLLAIAFIVLKLTGTISWSWWWVLSPILIPLGLGIGMMPIGLVGIFLSNVFK